VSVGQERRALLHLAAPLAAQQAGLQLMGTVDAVMLGRYSRDALAGAGVGNNYLFALTSIGMGIVMGMETVVPQALGAGRRDDARRAVGAGARLAVLVGLVATLAAFTCPLVLDLVGVDPALTDEARPYTYMRALGCVPFLLTIALRSYLAAHGRTRPLIVAMIVGNAVNALLDVVLIFGCRSIGLPPLGALGAGLATVAVQVVTVAVYAVAVRAIDAAAGTPRPPSTAADLRAIARSGGPVGGQILAEVGIFGIATLLAAHLGGLPAAAHAVALNLATLTYAVAMGLATATSTRVGLAVGAGDFARARARGLDAALLALLIQSMFALVFLVLPSQLAGLFTDDRAVIAACVPLLQVAAVFQLSDAAQAVGGGALRGLGRTRATLAANLFGHYTIGLPVMAGLALGANLGATGLWWGLCAGLTTTAVFEWWWFATGCSRGAP
jgi:MATE family multidrug resistance protein